MKVLWVLVVFTLGLACHFAAAKHGKKLPSAMVMGTVYCDTCFHQEFSKGSDYISGASVAVECGPARRPRFRKEVKTNERGEFKLQLPFSVGKNIKQIKRCSVKLLSSSDPYCSIASAASSSSLHLKSREQGVQIFSAGFFSFKPLKQPDLCFQKPTSSELQSSKTWLPYPDPTFPPKPLIPNLPPLLQIPPLPQLPSLPNLPTLPDVGPILKPPNTPIAPITTKSSEEKPAFFLPTPPLPFVPSPPAFGLPPNPFQPPPFLPPNPFQPPPFLPPNPFRPPSPPVIIIPPLPFLTPPPPPPLMPFPFPPFPFPPPHPIFPGNPPASTTASP